MKAIVVADTDGPLSGTGVGVDERGVDVETDLAAAKCHTKREAPEALPGQAVPNRGKKCRIAEL